MVRTIMRNHGLQQGSVVRGAGYVPSNVALDLLPFGSVPKRNLPEKLDRETILTRCLPD